MVTAGSVGAGSNPPANTGLSGAGANGAPTDAKAWEATLSSLSASSSIADDTASGDDLPPLDNTEAVFEDAADKLEEADARAEQDAAESDFVEDVEATATTGDTAPPGRPDEPAADGTNGKREYTVVDGDTLEEIAADYGQDVDDLLLANPGLDPDAVLEQGQVIAVYDAGRLDIARAIAATTDPAELSELIRKEILYATVDSSTPRDLLAAVKTELLARRGPDDAQFAALVDQEGGWAIDLWTRQGRTHEVMDQLEALTAAGDSAAIRDEVLAMLRDTAMRSPTTDAIEAKIEILLRYGPQDAVFTDAVAAASEYFNCGQIQEAAAQVAACYATLGPVEAAALLAQLTGPGNFDPLSAARLLFAAGDTISQIISHFAYGDVHAWPGSATGYFIIDLDGKEDIFGSLSVAVRNASESSESAYAIEHMAGEVNNQLFTYVVNSIIDEKGTELPLEMLRLQQTLDLYMPIRLGLDGLNSRNRTIANATNELGGESSDSKRARETAHMSEAGLNRMLDLLARDRANF